MTRWLVTLSLAASIAVAPAAWAQGADAKAAVELARQAKEAFDQGQWRGALELFEQAEDKAHSPVLVLYAARCHRNLGELIRARQLLQRVVDEPLGPDAPAPFKAARQDAADDLEQLDARIPTLTIDRSAAPKSWRVTVDGVAVEGDVIPVDPGSHVVRAGEAGRVTFERSLVIDEGSRVTVAIEGDSAAAPTRPVSPPATSLPVADEGGGFGASLGPGLIALGVGVAGVGVGVGLRVVALDMVADVKERCDGNQCLAEDAAEVETAETFQTVSTVLFAVGGAAMATGVVLMLVLPESEDAPSLGVDLRPGYLGLSGSF